MPSMTEIGTSPDSESAGILVIEFTASRTVRNKYMLFVRDPMYGICYRISNDWQGAIPFIEKVGCIQVIFLKKNGNKHFRLINQFIRHFGHINQIKRFIKVIIFLSTNGQIIMIIKKKEKQ